MWTQRLMWIAWPAFLAAGVLEMLVFAFVDPHELHWLGQALQWPAMAVYSVAFFVFWGVAMGACAMTALLALTPAELNRAAPLSGRSAD